MARNANQRNGAAGLSCDAKSFRIGDVGGTVLEIDLDDRLSRFLMAAL